MRPELGLALLGGLALLAGCSSQQSPRTEIPSVRAAQTASPPVLDGNLDERLWSSSTEVFVDTMSGAAAEPRASARIAYDRSALYIAFEVDDPLLRCDLAGIDAHLWGQDAVEVMIDPDADGRRYVELQVSPTNLVFDTWFDTPRSPPPFGHVGWSSALRSAVALRGTVNDADPDRGWSAEIAIPWSAFDAFGAAPPAAGAQWRIGLYVMDLREQGQLAVGWSAPLVGDFHVPDRFGRVTF